MQHDRIDLISNERLRLLCRIGRRYHVVTEEVKIGDLRFPFTRIANPDRVLDEVAAEADLRDRLQGRQSPGDELHLPYWAELWESARGIGEFLVQNAAEIPYLHRDICVAAPLAGRFVPSVSSLATPTKRPASGAAKQSIKCTNVQIERDLAHSRENSLPLSTQHSAPSTCTVLDLGCGMGMAGTVAAALGARVVFADLEAPALLFARLNSLPWRQRVRTRRLNWQRDRLDQQFDLILGADILYERAQWPWLHTFWRAHLAPGGRVILGEPGRQTGDLFIEWIASQGWQLTMSEVPVANRPRPIRIFMIS